MKIKKQYVVIATLVVALGVAVYLNWQLSGPESLSVANTKKELGVATYVNSSVTADESSTDSTSKNTGNLTAEQAEYFSASRTDREETQSDVLTLAKQVLELADSSEEAKEEAAEQLSKLENDMLSQNRIESTLKAKGFSDCLCFISDSACTVIVPKNEMQESSSLIIKDCVKMSCDIPSENIGIIEV